MSRLIIVGCCGRRTIAGKLLTLLILVHIFQYEIVRIHIECQIHFEGGKVDYVAGLVCGVVIPFVGGGIDNQHRLSIVALRGIVKFHILEGFDRLRQEPP